MPQSTIARWETGRMEPSFTNVRAAIRACDLRLRVEVTPVDRELEALVDEYARMTPAERFAQNASLVRFVDVARRRIAPTRA